MEGITEDLVMDGPKPLLLDVPIKLSEILGERIIY